MEHDCRIGILCGEESFEVVTLQALKKSIEADWNFCKYCAEHHEKYSYAPPKPYTFAEYADSRKITNLIRFKFCPFCGKKIDWKRIRKEG